MRLGIIVILFGFILTSFHSAIDSSVKYELTFEAMGCHYQISVNGVILDEGKTYQRINKTLDLTKQLTDSGEQKIDINMLRISREMTLKTTQAYLNLKLEKKQNDSTVLIKQVKLPTFPYDEDEKQPQSIGTSIEFERK